jgi:integrase
MPRLRNPLPSYLPHKQSGRARAVWTDATGGRHFRLLPGKYDSAESRAAFGRLVMEIDAAPAAAPPSPDGLSVAELLLAYLEHAGRHYRTAEGEPTSEVYQIRVVVRAVRELYAETPVAEFGPLCLKAARQRWVAEGRSRTECNRRVAVVKRIFKWGVSEELVEAPVFTALATVAGLQRGRTTAPECPPVGPADPAAVEAVLPLLNRHVRGMVEFQRLTGCRPGEACRVRRRDIDTGGDVWLYRPPHHKTAHRGKARVIAVGPKAQALLREFFTPNLDDYLFSPRRAVEEVRAARAAARKTPRRASQERFDASRRKAKPKRPPNERYARVSYRQAIDRACDRAFPPTGDLARLPKEAAAKWWARLTDEQRGRVKAWRNAHRWHPNQLRHAHGTEVRKRFGLEAAQAALGHDHADVTQVYAERNTDLAKRVAREIG